MAITATISGDWEELGIGEPILKAIKDEEFIQPTEIQEKAIPYVIKGKDVIGEAATGSGKTLAFASGIIQQTVKGQGVQALILSPTRELAQQTSEMIRDLSRYKPLKVITVYGGVSINPQIQDLRKADVVVGTPGRLLDHISRNSIDLRRLKILVLDECDRLLDMGFLPDIDRIISNLPNKRQTLLFSATISFEVSKLAHQYMDNPIEVEAEPHVDANKLTQLYYGPIEDSLKFSLFVHILKENQHKGLSLIFCNTRRYVDFLTSNLKNHGIKATALHGGMSQHERNKRLKRFQTEKAKILIATDVAARGLDISGITTVYNYDLPDTLDQYIHRIGRTARAGKAGKAITVISTRDSDKFMYLFRESRMNLRKEDIPYVKKLQTSQIRRPRKRNERLKSNGSSRHTRFKRNTRSKQKSNESRYSF